MIIHLSSDKSDGSFGTVGLAKVVLDSVVLHVHEISGVLVGIL